MSLFVIGQIVRPALGYVLPNGRAIDWFGFASAQGLVTNDLGVGTASNTASWTMGPGNALVPLTAGQASKTEQLYHVSVYDVATRTIYTDVTYPESELVAGLAYGATITQLFPAAAIADLPSADPACLLLVRNRT